MTSTSITHLFAELSCLEDLAIPLQRSARLQYTCLSVSNRYIALGSNTGGVYMFSRDTQKHLQVVFGDLAASPVVVVSISPNDLFVAFAGSNGQVVVVELNIEKRSRPERLRQAMDHLGSRVTAMVWDNLGSSLFVADSLGKVTQITVPTSKAKTLFTSPSQTMVQLDSGVFQMDWWSGKLLVSTQTRSYLLNTIKHQYSQIGKKSRDGEFGSCFFLEPSSQYPVIYCARPGSRIWEVDFEGNVLNTHQFKQLLATQSLPIISPELDLASAANVPRSAPQSVNFFKMLPIGEFILTWSHLGLYIFDPINVRVVLWTNVIKDIVDINILKNEVYIFLESQQVRRLIFMPIYQLTAALVSRQRCYLAANLILFLQHFAVKPTFLKRIKSEQMSQLLTFLKAENFSVLAAQIQAMLEDVSEGSLDLETTVEDEADRGLNYLKFAGLDSGIVVVNDGIFSTMNKINRSTSSLNSPVDLSPNNHRRYSDTEIGSKFSAASRTESSSEKNLANDDLANDTPILVSHNGLYPEDDLAKDIPILVSHKGLDLEGVESSLEEQRSARNVNHITTDEDVNDDVKDLVNHVEESNPDKDVFVNSNHCRIHQDNHSTQNLLDGVESSMTDKPTPKRSTDTDLACQNYTQGLQCSDFIAENSTSSHQVPQDQSSSVQAEICSASDGNDSTCNSLERNPYKAGMLYTFENQQAVSTQCNTDEELDEVDLCVDEIFHSSSDLITDEGIENLTSQEKESISLAGGDAVPQKIKTDLLNETSIAVVQLTRKKKRKKKEVLTPSSNIAVPTNFNRSSSTGSLKQNVQKKLMSGLSLDLSAQQREDGLYNQVGPNTISVSTFSSIDEDDAASNLAQTTDSVFEEYSEPVQDQEISPLRGDEQDQGTALISSSTDFEGAAHVGDVSNLIRLDSFDDSSTHFAALQSDDPENIRFQRNDSDLSDISHGDSGILHLHKVSDDSSDIFHHHMTVSEEKEIILPLIQRLSASGVAPSAPGMDKTSDTTHGLISEVSRRNIMMVKDKVSTKISSTTKSFIRRVKETNLLTSRSASNSPTRSSTGSRGHIQESHTEPKILIDNLSSSTESNGRNKKLDLTNFLLKTEETERLLQNPGNVLDTEILNNILNAWAFVLNQTLYKHLSQKKANEEKDANVDLESKFVTQAVYEQDFVHNSVVDKSVEYDKRMDTVDKSVECDERRDSGVDKSVEYDQLSSNAEERLGKDDQTGEIIIQENNIQDLQKDSIDSAACFEVSMLTDVLVENSLTSALHDATVNIDENIDAFARVRDSSTKLLKNEIKGLTHHIEWSEIIHLQDPFHLTSQQHTSVTTLATYCFECGCLGHVLQVFPIDKASVSKTHGNSRKNELGSTQDSSQGITSLPDHQLRIDADGVSLILDEERSTFLQLHYHFLSTSQVRKLLNNAKEKVVFKTWCAFIRCSQALGSGDIVSIKVEENKVKEALDYLRSGILPNKASFLGHLSSLFALSPLQVAEFGAEVPRQMTMRDILYLCQWHDKPSLQVITRYLDKRLTAVPPHKRADVIRQLCSCLECKLMVLECLLNPQLIQDPSNQKTGTDHIRIPPDVRFELLSILLSEVKDIEISLVQNILWKHSYLPGCLQLLVQTGDWEKALQLILQHADITWIDGSRSYGFTPRNLNQWKYLLKLFLKTRVVTTNQVPYICQQDLAIKELPTLKAASEKHETENREDILHVIDSNISEASLTDLAQHENMLSLADKKDSFLQVDRKYLELRGSKTEVGNVLGHGRLDCTSTQLPIASAQESNRLKCVCGAWWNTPLNAGKEACNSWSDSHCCSQRMSLKALAMLMAKHAGAKSAIHLLQECFQEEVGVEVSSADNSTCDKMSICNKVIDIGLDLDEEFYHTVIRLSVLERQQQLYIHNMLEKIDSYLWAKKPVHLSPQIYYAVMQEKSSQKSENQSYQELFYRHSASPESLPYPLAEDPDCHWGITTDVSRLCELCQVCLTETVSHMEPGIVVLTCGHAFHKFCIPENVCPLCF